MKKKFLVILGLLLITIFGCLYIFRGKLASVVSRNIEKHPDKLCAYYNASIKLSFSYPCTLKVKEQSNDEETSIILNISNASDLKKETSIYINIKKSDNAKTLSADRYSLDQRFCPDAVFSKLNETSEISQVPGYKFTEYNCLGNSFQYFIQKDTSVFWILEKYENPSTKNAADAILKTISIK